MARLLGIDIGRTTVRATLLRTSYRKVAVEGAGSCELSRVPEISEAIRVATAGLTQKADSVATSLDGDLVFLRKLELPLTAAKVLGEVVPFEIEAQLPFDIETAVFDYRSLPKEKNAEKIPILAAIAKQSDVSDRINTIAGAITAQPDVVVPGPLALVALAQVVQELAVEGPIALADLGAKRTDIVIMMKGDVLFARTLSAGVAGLPESAPMLEREIAQTFAAWRAGGGAAIQALYLAGGGATLHGAENFLTQKLGVITSVVPPLKIEGWPEGALGAPFAKAAGLALAMNGARKSLNLRQGPLAYERGFGFMRERVPLLAGLGSVLLVSFFFSTWAELRSLNQEQEVLDAALGTVSKEVLGEELHDPTHAIELLEKGPAGEEDPLPKLDAFDALYKLNEAIPKGTKHDIEEFDVQRLPGNTMKVSVHGIVPKVQDADDIVTALKLNKCFNDVKVVKTSPQIGGDGQKYVIEWDLKCVEEVKKPKAAASASDAPAAEMSREMNLVSSLLVNACSSVRMGVFGGVYYPFHPVRCIRGMLESQRERTKSTAPRSRSCNRVAEQPKHGRPRRTR
ncbi:MAG: pilus assembly protein PilM [Polyangiaceae bacterium]